jgi:hypothetical protein
MLGAALPPPAAAEEADIRERVVEARGALAARGRGMHARAQPKPDRWICKGVLQVDCKAQKLLVLSKSGAERKVISS